MWNKLAVLLVAVFLSLGSNAQSLVNVKTFGAKGDGKTDDTKAVLLAFSKVKSGGIVYFPAGIYSTKTIDIRPNRNSTITVYGDGVRSVIRKSMHDNANIALFFCEIEGVSLNFKNLRLDEEKGLKIPTYRKVGNTAIELISTIRGIYVWHLRKLKVSECTVSGFGGDGIAAFSTDTLECYNNYITNVLGSGILGHKVSLMTVRGNTISGCGLVPSRFKLGEQVFSDQDLHVEHKWGDGVSGYAKILTIKENKIVNCNRCAIVHDLAKDLGFKNSRADVKNNTIIVKSRSIKNSNPPAGMWFEQSSEVDVSHNKIDFITSDSRLVSGIRFYDITKSITCQANTLSAKNYTRHLDNAIGIFEPATEKIIIKYNKIIGKFLSAIELSYGGPKSGIRELIIVGNTASDMKNYGKSGIELSLDAGRRLPAYISVENNSLFAKDSSVLKVRVYGKAASTFKQKVGASLENNKVNNLRSSKISTNF